MSETTQNYHGSDGGPLPLEQLAWDLIIAIDAVHADPRYRAVWEAWQLAHGFYDGPNYAAELQALRRRLTIMN